MANAKGNPQNLIPLPRVGKEPLGGRISVRLYPEDEAKLRAMGGKAMQQFVRDAVAEKLERDAIALQQQVPLLHRADTIDGNDRAAPWGN